MQEISNKKFFKNYAIFILILLVIFSVLSYSVIAAKKSWVKNLSITVQNTLNETEAGRWKLGNNITINKPLTVNCAAYEVLDTIDNQIKNAVILRMVTIYGPVSCVFVYDEQKGTVEFIGYSSLHGRIRTQLMNNKSDKKQEYWKEKIPEILDKQGK